MKLQYFSSVILFVLLFCNCSTTPVNKEQYLAEYQSFIEKVEADRGDYSEKEWKALDESFEKYNKQLYSQFRADLKPSEKRVLAELRSRYKRQKGGDGSIMEGVGQLIGGMGKLLQDESIGQITDGMGELLGSDEMKDAIANMGDFLASNAMKDALGSFSETMGSPEVRQAISDFQREWETEIKGDLEDALEEAGHIWDDDLKAQFQRGLDDVKAALESGGAQAEIQEGIRELEGIMNDEQVKGEMREALGELKDALDKMGEELNE